MNEKLSYNISYDNMKKLLKIYYAQQGRNVELRISNEIDTDRFNGMVTTSVQMIEKTTIGGVESKSQCYLSINDLKKIVGKVLEQEGKELMDLTDNAVSTNRVEGYGMGEHTVKSVTNKSFTITAKEKKQVLGR